MLHPSPRGGGGACDGDASVTGNSPSSQPGVPQRRGEAPRASSLIWVIITTPPPSDTSLHLPPPTPIKNPAPYHAPLYQFCLTPHFGRGNNSEKRGNSPGIFQDSPTGIIEVICSNVTIASARSTLASAKPFGPRGGYSAAGNPSI